MLISTWTWFLRTGRLIMTHADDRWRIEDHAWFRSLEHLQPRTPKRFGGRRQKIVLVTHFKGRFGPNVPQILSGVPSPSPVYRVSIRNAGYNFYTCFSFGGHVWGTRLVTGAPQTRIRSGHPPNNQSSAFFRTSFGGYVWRSCMELACNHTPLAAWTSRCYYLGTLYYIIRSEILGTTRCY
jgi:hypothetical protein